MKDIFDTFIKAVPIFQNYPFWFRGLTTGWIVFTASLVIAFLYAKPKISTKDIEPPLYKIWPTNTGDHNIDMVCRELNEVAEKSNGKIPESELIGHLKPLFLSPAFSHVNEEPRGSLMFRLCSIQTLLEYYIVFFKNNPDARKEIGIGTTRIIKLYQKLSELYGPTFSVVDHYKKYPIKENFIENLPPMIKRPDNLFDFQCNTILNELKRALIPTGLMDV